MPNTILGSAVIDRSKKALVGYFFKEASMKISDKLLSHD